MTALMRSVAITGTQEFTPSTVAVPECAPGEALVKVAYCGICGSDIPRYFDGKVHNFPQVLGHEFSGVVTDAGSASEIRPGTRVAVAPLVPCHECDRCEAGAPAQCGRYTFIGSSLPGAMAEYVKVPVANLVPVPDELSLKAAALIEPLAVAIHGVDRVRFEKGSSATVLGGGVIGLMTLLTLLDRGAGTVTVIDVEPWNLEVAKRLGADHTLNALTDDLGEHFAAIGAPQLVIETAGAAATRRQALEIAGKGGSVVYVGTPTTDLTLPPKTFERILRRELTVLGSWMSYSAPFPGSEWTEAARILSSPELKPEEFVTHEFSLAELARGFDTMRSGGEHRRLKIMFRVGGEEPSP